MLDFRDGLTQVCTGSVDLMYILKMDWKTALEVMVKIEHGTHVKMSCVQTEPVVALVFEPIGTGTQHGSAVEIGSNLHDTCSDCDSHRGANQRPEQRLDTFLGQSCQGQIHDSFAMDII